MTALLRRPALRRFRALLAATVIAGTALGIEATPVPVPAPIREALTTPVADASFCASNPNFAGHMTENTSTTAAAGRIKDATIYGYITDVNKTWSCTAFLRYDGAAWNVTSSAGRFDWGVVISSTSVSCNYVVGSNNFIKGNPSTTGCWTSDTQYALPMTLGAERVYQMDTAHNSIGDMMYIHSDCGTLYGGGDGEATSGTEMAPESFAGSNAANRPGANCDPLTIDGFQGQTITYDKTAPTISVTAPAGSAGTIVGAGSTSYTVTINATDGVAKFGSAHPWTLQRQVARNTGTGTCDPFANDTGTNALVTGTTSASGQTSAQTLTVGNCYRWILTGSDMNGNTAAAVTSATLIVDTTAPVVTFLNPAVDTVQNTTSFSVVWSETESGSGIATRSLQRQKVAISGGTCPGAGWANDGSAVTTASPVAATLTSGSCYRWLQTLTDKAGNGSSGVPSSTSPTVLVDTALPMATSVTPAPGTTAVQTASTYNVSWTETAGSGATISSRTLVRKKVATASHACGTSWAVDATYAGQTSPKADTGLVTGNCYRWEISLTNSLGKSSTTISGIVIMDTTAPTGSIVAPAANQPGSGAITITGTADDADSFLDYLLEYGVGASPSSWTTIFTGSVPVSSTGILSTWATSGLSGVYTLRLTTHDRAGNTMTPVTTTVVLENAARGTESYLTRIPYDLGGGYTLDIGVANGEARLSRDLFSIPSFGASQALSLTYSSAESGTTGKFGVGWSSNLTQYLTFETAGITTWHRADGGREPFGNVGGTWIPGRGHYETMTIAGAEVTIATRDLTYYVFESSGAGRLKRIENRHHTPLTLTWGTSSATATDYSGRSTTIAIDSTNNRITGVTDSAGRAWGFGYTGTGTASDLTTITDPASKATTLGYTSHALTTVQRSRSPGPLTITWTIGYTAGKATSVQDPIATHASTFTYNAGVTLAQQLIDDTTPAYAETDYTLDPAGRGWVIATTDAEGQGTGRVFDDAGNVVQDNIPTDGGTAQTISTYDAAGNLLSERKYLDASTYVDTLYTYNAINDILTRTDSDNDSATRTVTLYTYDAGKRLQSVDRNCTSSGTTIPGSGAGGACTGAGTKNADTNVVTTYTYTGNDQLEYEQDPMGVTTKHVYDSYGNETSVITDCTSSGTTLPSPFYTCTAAGTHDGATNVTTTTAYLATDTDGKAGLATSTTDALGRTTSFDYDALGRQTSEVLPGDASVPVLTRTTTYDELGNTLTEAESWTPSGGTLQTRTTSHAYDMANRETSLTDPTTTTSTTTTYDVAGNATLTKVASSGITVSTTVRTFDDLGRLYLETLQGDDAEARSIDHYTALGAVALETNTDSTTVETTTRFDGLVTGTVTAAADDSSQATTDADYDKLGQETSSTDELGTTAASTYDHLGRLLTSIVAGATTTYEYDRDGNQTKVTDPAGIVTTTMYDALNRATVVVANDVASPTLPTDDVTTTTYYDAAGNAIAVKDPRLISTRTIINARDQASETIADCTDSGTTPTTAPASCTGAGTHDDTANVVTDLTYDGQGNVVKAIAGVGRPAAATTETAYDAAGHVQATRDPMGTITRNKYNPAGQLTDTYVNCTTSGTTVLTTGWESCTGAGTADGTWNLHTSYTYDVRGNQAQVTAPERPRIMAPSTTTPTGSSPRSTTTSTACRARPTTSRPTYLLRRPRPSGRASGPRPRRPRARSSTA